MSCPLQSGRSATEARARSRTVAVGAVVVELEPQELAVVGRGLDVAELLDEADGLERLRCRRIAGRRQQVAEQGQGLRLGCDLGRPTQARDRGVRTTFEGVDPGEAEQRGGILGTRRQRVGECGPRQGGVPGQARVLPHRVGVERRIRGVRRQAPRARAARAFASAPAGSPVTEARRASRMVTPGPPTGVSRSRSARASSIRPSSSSASNRVASALVLAGSSRTRASAAANAASKSWSVNRIVASSARAGTWVGSIPMAVRAAARARSWSPRS